MEPGDVEIKSTEQQSFQKPIQKETSRVSETQSSVDVSHANITRVTDGFIKSAIEKGKFANKDEAYHAIRAEEESLGNCKVTINLTPESISRFLEKGTQETFWDHLVELGNLDQLKGQPTTQGKSLTSEYIEYRKISEDGMRPFVPEEARSINPIYGSLAAERDLTTGASSQYGKFFLVLNPNNRQLIYNFGDSFGNIERQEKDGLVTHSFSPNNLLTYEDALKAKAIVNLMNRFNAGLSLFGITTKENLDKFVTIEGKNATYVEAVIFEPINSSNLEMTGVSIYQAEDIKDAGKLLANFPDVKSILSIFAIRKCMGELTADWLDENFKKHVTWADGGKEAEKSVLWDELGLKPTSSYDEIRDKLAQTCTQLWQEIGYSLDPDFRGLPPMYLYFDREIEPLIKERSEKGRVIREDIIDKARKYVLLNKEKLFFTNPDRKS